MNRLLLGFVLPTLLLLSACGTESENRTATSPQWTRIWVTAPGAEPTARYKGTYDEIEAIQLVIYDNVSALIDNLSLTDNGSAWVAETPRLVQNQTYNFVGKAYNDNVTKDNTTEIFQGQTITSLDSDNFTLNLRFNPIPVEGFANLAIPRITSITRSSASMVPNTTDNVSVTIAANAEVNISYAFLETVGAFDPDNGSILIGAGGNITLESEFTIDNQTGNFTQSIRVENLAGLGVEARFSILVQTTFSPEVIITYSPVILALGAQLYDNGSLGWEAEVSDDNVTELYANWSLSQPAGTDFIEFGSGTISGDNVTFSALSTYNPSENGTLRLSILSDSGDNTTLTYPFQANQFQTTYVPQGTYNERISAGDNHTCAVLDNGSVSCWGDNSIGQLQVPAMTGATQVSAGRAHSCGLDNGIVRCWGDNSSGQLLTGLSNLRMMTMGGDSSCVLDSNLQTQCAGDNSSGQLPDNGTGPLVQLSLSSLQSCGIHLSGPVQCWGSGLVSIPDGVDNHTVQLSVGDNHTCAVLDNGFVSCWGDNSSGQLGDGVMDFSSPAVQVDTGAKHSCVRLENQTLRCWGDRTGGKIGNGTTTGVESTPSFVGNGLNSVRFVTAGKNHSCGLTTGDTVQCWGENTAGQLGDGTYDNRSLPVPATEY